MSCVNEEEIDLLRLLRFFEGIIVKDYICITRLADCCERRPLVSNSFEI